MTHTVLQGLVLAAVLAAEVTASNAQSDSKSEVSIVGCLVRKDTSALRPGTSGTTPPVSGAVQTTLGFVLKEAAIWKGTSPPSGQVSTHSDREFGLTTNKDVGLDEHANHQVEIRGWLVSASDPEHEVLPLPPTHDGNVIQIVSIRSLSDECPPRH
jgi:hypothetical protein